MKILVIQNFRWMDLCKLILSVIYRPPDTSEETFSELCDIMNTKHRVLPTPLPEIICMGDFNFPNVKWELYDPNCIPVITGSTQLKAWCELACKFYLSQIIQVPTRDKNILDLVWTNNEASITDIVVTPIFISDHNLVSIQTEWTLKYKTQDVVVGNSSGLSSLNFHKAKWRELNDALIATDWNKILNNENQK